jgi:hypothetical protein
VYSNYRVFGGFSCLGFGFRVYLCCLLSLIVVGIFFLIISRVLKLSEIWYKTFTTVKNLGVLVVGYLGNAMCMLFA